ncbi:LppU/SCO3897 family protein [Streptomyces sp. MspMP-M5]|uniref:LppU/SCO3897 family protein n=1 Tax=Streptomyces sp. MspMP-M5 TaxID=1155718 RepID=UPI003B6407B3
MPPVSGPQPYGQPGGPGPYGPPPPHQGSYGQAGQGSYGAPAQVSYGAVPYPPAPQPYGQVQPPQGGVAGVPGALPPSRRPTNTTRARIVAVVAIVVLGVAFWLLSRGPHAPHAKFADEAQVGDCVEKSGSGDGVVLEVVGCASSKANYKVALRYPAGGRCPDGFSEYEKTRGSLVTLRLCLSPAER